MTRTCALLVCLACVACGGKLDRAGASADAGAPADAGTAPASIAVGDAGLVCSVPSVSADDAGADQCTFAMTCSDGVTVEGHCFGGGCVLRCMSNGTETGTFTALGAAAGDQGACTSPAGLAAMAGGCPP